MLVTRWSMCCAAGLFLAPASAHTAQQTFYTLSQRSGADQLLSYDVAQDPFLDDQGYLPDMVAPISDSALGPESLIAMAASGSKRYGPGTRSGPDTLLIYDLTQGPFLNDPDHLPETVLPISDSILKP